MKDRNSKIKRDVIRIAAMQNLALERSEKRVRPETEEVCSHSDSIYIYELEGVDEKIMHDFRYFLQFVPSFEILLTRIFKDFHEFRFSDYSSVPSSEGCSHLEFRFGNRFGLLSRINLYDHTILVAKKAVDLNQNIPPYALACLVIMSLAHDAGKNGRIERLYGETTAPPHEIISARYLEQISYANGLSPEKITPLSNAIKNMHYDKRNKMNDIQERLVTADLSARSLELETLINAERETQLHSSARNEQ